MCAARDSRALTWDIGYNKLGFYQVDYSKYNDIRYRKSILTFACIEQGTYITAEDIYNSETLEYQ